MITALAPAPTLTPSATAGSGEEAWPEADFAAGLDAETESDGEDAMELLLAGLMAAPVPAPPGEDGASAEPDAALSATPPLPPVPTQGVSPDTAPAETPADAAVSPPSAETALRLQMADEAGGKPPSEQEAPDADAVDLADPPPALARQTVAPTTAADSATASPPLTLSAPAAPPPRALPALAPPPPPDAPPARQAAEAISAALSNPGGSDRVELVLRPEELGRVRFELRSEGDRLVVTMTADRPETMDLLRRHLPELRAELEQAGYGAADLNFGQSGTPGGQAEAHVPAASTDFLPMPSPPPALPPAPRATASGGLDLRL